MPALFLIVLIDLIGFGIIIPLLPFYGEHFQASPWQVGALMATYSLTQFIAAPLWGRLSDRIGRRPVLLISLAGSVVAYVWLGLADTLWVLFAARAVGGAMAGNIAAAFAYVADITTPENRARGMGMVGAAFGIGFIFGPAIGGLLAGNDAATADFQSPAFAAAGLSALALIMSIILLKESLPAEVRGRHAAAPHEGRFTVIRRQLSRPAVAMPMVLSFIATFVFAGMETTFAMWSFRQFGWGPEQNGYLFAFVGVISAVVQGGLLGRLARRWGEETLIITGAVCLCVGIGAIPFASTVALLVPAMAIAAIGFSLLTPSLSSLVSLRISADMQGSGMGVSRSVTTLARVLGPNWAGAWFFFLGKDAPFIIGAVLMVGFLVLARRLPAADQSSASS